MTVGSTSGGVSACPGHHVKRLQFQSVADDRQIKIHSNWEVFLMLERNNLNDSASHTAFHLFRRQDTVNESCLCSGVFELTLPIKELSEPIAAMAASQSE
ncbi:MAG: hypothetical protein OXB95_06140 [Rhodobacteraceae bacterium]|nr:hypothetical protein [Paracoccaceae bacterium]